MLLLIMYTISIFSLIIWLKMKIIIFIFTHILWLQYTTTILQYMRSGYDKNLWIKSEFTSKVIICLYKLCDTYMYVQCINTNSPPFSSICSFSINWTWRLWKDISKWQFQRHQREFGRLMLMRIFHSRTCFHKNLYMIAFYDQ